MTPPGPGSRRNRLLLPRGFPLPPPPLSPTPTPQDPFQMVRLPGRRWGWAENVPEARNPSPGWSAKLRGGSSGSYPRRPGSEGWREGSLGREGEGAAAADSGRSWRPGGSLFLLLETGARGSGHLDAGPRSAAWAQAGRAHSARPAPPMATRRSAFRSRLPEAPRGHSGWAYRLPAPTPS